VLTLYLLPVPLSQTLRGGVDLGLKFEFSCLGELLLPCLQLACLKLQSHCVEWLEVSLDPRDVCRLKEQVPKIVEKTKLIPFTF
jgi:hypothetical protein